MKKTANIWEYKVGINAIIANFVCMWKTRIHKVGNIGIFVQLLMEINWKQLRVKSFVMVHKMKSEIINSSIQLIFKFKQ